MFIRILRRVLSEMKAEAQLNKDMRRLVRSELDYGALQRMIDNVTLGNVEMEIRMSDKTIVIKPKTTTNATPTFYQAYLNSR